MQRILGIIAALMVMALSACGGGSSSSSDNNNDGGGDNPPQLENVALQDNGGVADASYDDENADIVNDGSVSGSFWAGAAEDDQVTVAFDQEYSIKAVTIYTNATNNQDTQLQLSDDGQNFTDIGYVAGTPSCFTLNMGTDGSGNDRIFCELDSAIDATHVRVVITTSSATSVQIHEIEAMGS